MKSIYKVLFMGSMGAGKTTAIQQLSQTSVVSTEAKNNDTGKFNKETTTVGLDYGIINIDETCIHLYGSPGQDKFSFIWSTLIKGADGVIILVNHEQNNALQELETYLEFIKPYNNLAVTLGIGRNGASDITPYEEIIKKFDIDCPIFLVDVRKKEDSLFLLESLVYQIFD